jgi:hypothetical protein
MPAALPPFYHFTYWIRVWMALRVNVDVKDEKILAPVGTYGCCEKAITLAPTRNQTTISEMWTESSFYFNN